MQSVRRIPALSIPVLSIHGLNPTFGHMRWALAIRITLAEEIVALPLRGQIFINKSLLILLLRRLDYFL
jgi:hypothetical protein